MKPRSILYQLTPHLYARRRSEDLSLSPDSPNECICCDLYYCIKTRMFHNTGSSWFQLTSLLNVCVFHIHFLILPEWTFQSERTSVKGEGGDTKPGISAILAATQNQYYFSPLPKPPLAPSRPFPPQQEGGGGAAGCVATCRGVEELRLSLTQRGENGSFLQDPFWTRDGCGGWVLGACARRRRDCRARGVAPHCGRPCAGHWGWAAAAPGRPGCTQPPRPPPSGGIHSLPVAKAGGKAGAEALQKPEALLELSLGKLEVKLSFQPFFWAQMWEETQASAL